MKYTVCVTQACNLDCDYCYISKRKSRMSIPVAEKIIDFAFRNTPADEEINIGFFGGEPLTEFDLIKRITHLIESHPSFDTRRVQLMTVTNGTLFSDEIADYFNTHNISIGISCDGHPEVQDVFRKYANGKGSSAVVEKTIKRAVEKFETPLVNAVYHPDTFRQLPRVVEYFSSLGIRNIYLNPDYSASWSALDISDIPGVYAEVADLYLDYYVQGDPHFISLVDSKIALILREGYQDNERCRMGKGEFAFTTEGRVYPCERLIGSGLGPSHCMGDIDNGFTIKPFTYELSVGENQNPECQTCSLSDYCMNTCGCSNFFSTGSYRRVNAFQCESEKAAISTAFAVIQALESTPEAVFFDHFHGHPAFNSIYKDSRR